MLSPHRLRAFGARAVVLLVPAMSACVAAARTLPDMETDRPDLTEGTATVPLGTAQLESGWTHTRDHAADAHAIGEVLLRVATSPRSEFRLFLNSYELRSAGAQWDRGMEDAAVGAKVRLFARADDARGLVPDVSLLAATTLPTGSNGTGAGTFLPEAKLATKWTFTDRVSLGGNLIASREQDGSRPFTQGGASLSLGADWTDRLGSYVEWYAFRPFVGGALAQHTVNGGLTFGLTDDFQIDARVGAAVGGASRERFVGVGLARRWRR